MMRRTLSSGRRSPSNLDETSTVGQCARDGWRRSGVAPPQSGPWRKGRRRLTRGAPDAQSPAGLSAASRQMTRRPPPSDQIVRRAASSRRMIHDRHPFRRTGRGRCRDLIFVAVPSGGLRPRAATAIVFIYFRKFLKNAVCFAAWRRAWQSVSIGTAASPLLGNLDYDMCNSRGGLSRGNGETSPRGRAWMS